MRLDTEAIILAVRPHGEHGAVVRALTAEAGVVAGYVRGGRSRRLRPVLMPGNAIAAAYRARAPGQLARLTAELATSRAALHSEPLAAAGLVWAVSLTAAALPEEQPYPALHAALDGLLSAVGAAPSARAWAAALARYELLLLRELGFGLDLDRCALSGAAGPLAFVSPRSGRAVTADAAGLWSERLLPLPAFLVAGGPAEWPAIAEALALTGHFLARDVLIGRQADSLAARARLLDRLAPLFG